MRTRTLILSVLIAAGVLTPAIALATQDAPQECNADIRGTLMRKEGSDKATKFTAKIEVTARHSCAVVDFELIVVEDMTGGETHEVRVPRQARIRDSRTVTMKLDYKLAKGRAVASHRFEQVSCEVCD